jgi:hypothetical protein
MVCFRYNRKLNQMYSIFCLIGLLLCGALANSASDGDNTGSRSKVSACRERLIVLEDEYEDLSNRYKNVLEDYKEVKQELREHLSRERAAEVCLLPRTGCYEKTCRDNSLFLCRSWSMRLIN